MNNLLPIGTVVSVGSEQNGYMPVVIAGYGGKNSKNKIYDYIGFLFPYGYISRDKVIVFESSLIHEVIHKGYEDENYKEMIPNIKAEINAMKGDQ